LKALLAAKIALSSFDGNVSEKKLDLFELTSCLMTEPSTRSGFSRFVVSGPEKRRLMLLQQKQRQR
jgi:hypothetical protein